MIIANHEKRTAYRRERSSFEIVTGLIGYAFFFDLSSKCKRKKNPTIRTTPKARQTTTFFMRPATMKHTKLIAATVIAYGSWVDTWFT